MENFKTLFKTQKLKALKLLGTLVLFFITINIFAQFGGIGMGSLESKLHRLTQAILNVILPAVSILGLIYSAILAAIGDQGAKPRMVMVLFASVMGFLSPLIIGWLQRVSGF